MQTLLENLLRMQQKSIVIDKSMIAVSSIIPRNDELNNKANELNDQLKAICRNATIDYLCLD